LRRILIIQEAITQTGNVNAVDITFQNNGITNMTSVIKIGNTQAEVRITHSKRSLLYFTKNFFNIEVPHYMEELIRKIDNDQHN